MAMMISKFHKLIQSRLLWIVFLVVIVFSFVIWGMADTSATQERGRQDVARLHGKGVDSNAFHDARRSTYASLVLSTGRMLSMDDALNTYLDDQAWKRIVSRSVVRDHGLRAPDAMVEAGIRNHPAFQEEGAYKTQNYLSTIAFLQNTMRITEPGFHEIMREDIELQLLQRSVASLVPVTPHETGETLRMLTDRYTVQYAELLPGLVAEQVSLTDEEIEAFYAADPERYRTSEKFRLAYVVFPYDDYRDAVPEISEEEILQYYEVNQSRYRIRSEADAEEEEEEGDAEEQYRTLDEVRGDIRRELIRAQARRLAVQEADDFVHALTPTRSGEAPEFDALRQQKGLAGGEIPPFTPGSRPDFEDAAGPIGSAAPQLDLTPEFYFSDTLQGEQGAYVVALKAIIPPEIPPFAEAREQVAGDARREAERKALEEMAQALHDEVSAAMAEGQSFAAALEGQEAIELKEAGPFSLMEAMYSEPLVGELMPALATYDAGELMELVLAGDRALIVYVQERTTEEGAMLSFMRSQIQSGLAQRRAGLVFDAYQQHLLEEAGFEDLRHLLRRDEEQREEDDG